MLQILSEIVGPRCYACRQIFWVMALAALSLLAQTRPAVADESTQALPTVTSFSPNSGKFPDFMTINGTNFTGATQVTIGGIPSAKITIVSPTEIKALVRSLAKTGIVSVTTPAGTASSTAVFTVTWTANEGPDAPPTITSFTPTSGKFPDMVTITGTNFTGASQVTIGGVPSAKITVDSPTQITALVRSIAYTGPITVTTMRGTATSAETFTVTKRY